MLDNLLRSNEKAISALCFMKLTTYVERKCYINSYLIYLNLIQFFENKIRIIFFSILNTFKRVEKQILLILLRSDKNRLVNHDSCFIIFVKEI